MGFGDVLRDYILNSIEILVPVEILRVQLIVFLPEFDFPIVARTVRRVIYFVRDDVNLRLVFQNHV